MTLRRAACVELAALAVCCSLCLVPGRAAAQPTAAKSAIVETSGIAVGASVPTGIGIAGVRVDYYLQLPSSWFRVAVHAAFGLLFFQHPVGEPTTTLGLMGSWGFHHRPLLEFLVGTLRVSELHLHGVPVATRTDWGVQVLAGYEYMALSGFYLRSGIGAMYVWEPDLFAQGPWGLAIKLIDIGVKLW